VVSFILCPPICREGSLSRYAWVRKLSGFQGHSKHSGSKQDIPTSLPGFEPGHSKLTAVASIRRQPNIIIKFYEVLVSYLGPALLLSLDPQPSLGFGLLHKIRLNFVEVSQQFAFLQGRVVSPTPNPHPGGPDLCIYISQRQEPPVIFSRVSSATPGIWRISTVRLRPLPRPCRSVLCNLIRPYTDCVVDRVPVNKQISVVLAANKCCIACSDSCTAVL
jgi:hypothetical protein